MKEKVSEEFRNFDDAMNKLLTVSYQDLQKRLEEEKRSKPPRRKRATSSTSRASSSRKKRAS